MLSDEQLEIIQKRCDDYRKLLDINPDNYDDLSETGLMNGVYIPALLDEVKQYRQQQGDH